MLKAAIIGASGYTGAELAGLIQAHQTSLSPVCMFLKLA